MEAVEDGTSSVRVYKYRWIILLIFCLYSSINFLQFLQYSIISNPSNLVRNSDDMDAIGQDFLTLMIINASVTTAFFVPVLLFFRAKPEVPPSQSQVNIGDAGKPSIWSSVKAMAKNRNYLLLLVAFGSSNGMYSSFGIMINRVYLHYFTDYVIFYYNSSSHYVHLCCSFNGVGKSVGNVLYDSSFWVLHRKHSPRRLRVRNRSNVSSACSSLLRHPKLHHLHIFNNIHTTFRCFIRLNRVHSDIFCYCCIVSIKLSKFVLYFAYFTSQRSQHEKLKSVFTIAASYNHIPHSVFVETYPIFQFLNINVKPF